MQGSAVHIITDQGWASPGSSLYSIECTCGLAFDGTACEADRAYGQHIVDAIRANRAEDKQATA